MDKQTLRECIFDGLLEVCSMEGTFINKDDNLDFTASFLAGWLWGAIRYETVDLELDKKGK